MKRVLAIALFLMIFAAAPAHAQEGSSSPDWTDLHSVLEFVAAGGGAAILAATWSWLAENVAAWHALDSRVKFALGIVFSGVLSLLAQIALNLDQIEAGEFTLTIWEVWRFAATGGLAWLASQAAYMVAKNNNYAG